MRAHIDQFSPAGTTCLPAALAARIPAGAGVTMLDYYQGPFQEFEEAVTRDMTWDVEPSLAILPGTVGDLLELGAGGGRLTAPLAQVADTLVAVERSPVAVAGLRARFGGWPKIHVVESALEDYREPRSFDVVALLGLSVHVLPWSTTTSACSLAAERLRPGGSFCLNVLADAASDRMAAMDDTVRRRRYRDRTGRERDMLTTTRFDRASRTLSQYWLIAPEAGCRHVVAASMRSHFWRVDMLLDTLTRAGLDVCETSETSIDGGAGEGSGVVFVRAGLR